MSLFVGIQASRTRRQQGKKDGLLILDRVRVQLHLAKTYLVGKTTRRIYPCAADGRLPVGMTQYGKMVVWGACFKNEEKWGRQRLIYASHRNKYIKDEGRKPVIPRIEAWKCKGRNPRRWGGSLVNHISSGGGRGTTKNRRGHAVRSKAFA